MSKFDISTLENVLKATKVAHVLKSLTYDDGFTDLGLMKLSCRRLRSDLIQFYKIINSVDKINWYSEPFKLNPRGGHRTIYILLFY